MNLDELRFIKLLKQLIREEILNWIYDQFHSDLETYLNELFEEHCTRHHQQHKEGETNE